MIEMHELTDTEVELGVWRVPTSANTSQRRLMTLSALPSGVNLVTALVFYPQPNYSPQPKLVGL